MFRVTLCLGLMALVPPAIAEPESAVGTATTLQRALQQDKQQHDWHAYLADAQRLKTFLNGSPDSTLEVARGYLHLGKSAAALAQAHEFVAMGQIHPLLDSAEFRPLRTALDAQIQANKSEVSVAHQMFTLADPRLLPEDIDYDAKTQHFFITSVVQHKIVVVDLHGTQRDFAQSPDHWPMMAIKIDVARRRLWATEVAVAGFADVPKAEQGRSVLLEYDLDQGSLLNRYDSPSTQLGDLVLDAGGEPLASDGDGGGIYQLHGSTLRRIDHGDFVSPQTIAVCPKDHSVFVPDYARGVARLNPVTGAATWLASNGRYALQGIDGLYCRDATLIATQNGTSPERVQRFVLDSTRATVVSESSIERGTPTLGDPTHGVIVGDDFYYIANSGWDVIDDRGTVKSGAAMSPARIMRTTLPASSQQP